METVMRAKIKVFKNNEYVASGVIEDGTLMDLDKPLDFNYAVHTELCNQIELAILSGEEVVISGHDLQSHFTWTIQSH